MSDLSRDEIAEITYKADLVSKKLLNKLYTRGFRGEELRRAAREILPDLPDLIRSVDATFGGRRPLAGAERDENGNLAPSALKDVHPDIDPELVQWTFEQVALLLVRERLGPDPDDGG
jgi:hypothetical protein